MTDRTHLDALNRRLANEKDRLATARTDTERALRSVWAAQIEKEIAGEIAFLNREMREPVPAEIEAMSDDELLAELLA